MIIDLTAAVPCVLMPCDVCEQEDRLYRLIGTELALCPACFEHEHVQA